MCTILDQHHPFYFRHILAVSALYVRIVSQTRLQTSLLLQSDFKTSKPWEDSNSSETHIVVFLLVISLKLPVCCHVCLFCFVFSSVFVLALKLRNNWGEVNRELGLVSVSSQQGITVKEIFVGAPRKGI